MDTGSELTRIAEQLYRQMVDYDRGGDVYNAVKVGRRLARLMPDWSAPFAYLGGIYKSRKEWKPVLHYCNKALDHNPLDDTVWNNLALAATALQEWDTARRAWNQLGFSFKDSEETLELDLGMVPARLNPKTKPEVIEARRIDPARAYIESIPQPSSERRYKDLILLDTQPQGSYFLNGKNLKVYEELQVLKSSSFKSFAVILHTSSLKDIGTLAALCLQKDLGFDNWSNAVRFLQPGLHQKISDYFEPSIFGNLQRDEFLVAIASRQPKEVVAVLKDWEVITLRSFSGLEQLF